MKVFTPLAAVPAAAILLCATVSCCSADDLALDAAKRNRSAVESIHSLSCRVTKSSFGKDGDSLAPSPEVQYWRSGTNFRALSKLGDQWSDMLVKGLQLWGTANHPPRAEITGTIAAYQGLPILEGDPWLETLVMFMGDINKGKPLPIFFADILEVKGVKVTARQERKAGKEWTVIEGISPGGRSRGEYWVDPSVNHLISRNVLTPGTPDELVATTEVERFSEVAPGVFFPTLVTRTNTRRRPAI